MAKKEKYYSLKPILSKNAYYNMIIGQRSNGKTYSVKKLIIENFVSGKGQAAYIRRYRDDFTANRGGGFFNDVVKDGVVTRATNGEWSGVAWYKRQWWFCRPAGDDPTTIERCEAPFCTSFALTEMEHDKSSSYPDITTICFDEFMTRTTYLTDEFVLFMNTLSTIIRDRNNVKIFMLGNTVTKDCPYFKEMGLTHVMQMEKGDIEVYKYGNSPLTVAVEFADAPAGRRKKPSDFYFAFNNPKLKMITDSVWEIGLYKHKPVDFTPRDIKFIFFIRYHENLLQCEVVMFDRYDFLYIHPKTTDLKHPERDLIFDSDADPRYNWSRKITQGKDKVGIVTKVLSYFNNEKVFFSDNETGEVVHNYLQWCKSDSIYNG